MLVCRLDYLWNARGRERRNVFGCGNDRLSFGVDLRRRQGEVAGVGRMGGKSWAGQFSGTALTNETVRRRGRRKKTKRDN